MKGCRKHSAPSVSYDPCREVSEDARCRKDGDFPSYHFCDTGKPDGFSCLAWVAALLSEVQRDSWTFVLSNVLALGLSVYFRPPWQFGDILVRFSQCDGFGAY